MAEPHVISALRAKRAELSGDLIAAQKRLEKLRDDFDAVDRTLRVFDPRQHPEKIRPIVKRKGDRMSIGCSAMAAEASQWRSLQNRVFFLASLAVLERDGLKLDEIQFTASTRMIASSG